MKREDEQMDDLSVCGLPRFYQIALVLSKNLSEKQLKTILNALRLNYIYSEYHESLDKSSKIIFIGCNNVNKIFETASKIGIYKPPLDTTTEKYVQEQRKSRLILSKLSAVMNEELYKLNPLITVQLNHFLVSEKTISRLKENNKEKYDDPQNLLEYFSSSERIEILHYLLYHAKLADLQVVNHLEKEGYLLNIFALHDTSNIKSTISDIEAYFGPNVSIYFEFFKFYNKHLLFLGLFGLFCYLNEHLKITTIQSGYIYALVVVIWVHLFSIYWQRQEKTLQARWNNLTKTKSLISDRNQRFQGKIRQNLVTGLPEEYYPSSKRLVFYLISFLESLPLLIITTVLKLMIFNVNGLIDDETSILYIKSLADMNKPKGVLYQVPMIDTILNLVVVTIIIQINLFYVKTAKISTARENHMTNQHFNDSLIFKRFFFEFLNRFFHFFYLAYMNPNFEKIQQLMSSMFLIDEVRKVVVEILIPFLLKYISDRKLKKTKTNDDKQKKDGTYSQIQEDLSQLTLWEYDDFDDYIEVLFQLTWITMFAGLFPLASIYSWFFNLIELKSDMEKLTRKLYIRNIPIRVKSIGMWILVINILGFMSLYSNFYYMGIEIKDSIESKTFDNSSLLFSLPKESGGEYGECFWDLVKERILIIDHIVILLIFLLRTIIPKYPKWVHILKAKKEYLQKNHSSI